MIADIDSVNHVGVAVRDMDAAAALYERMGFTVSPVSVHSGSEKPGEPVQKLSSGNRCAVFEHNYVELLGIVAPERPDWGGMRKLIERFQGAHIICFGCGEAETVDKRLRDQDVKTSGVIALQRDVETPDGTRTPRFDCVHFDRDMTPEGLVQAAHHRDPEYIHQPRYLTHGNGATALQDVVVASLDPESEARKYELLTDQAPYQHGRGFAIDLPVVSRLVFLHAADLNAEFRGTLFSPVPSVVAMGFPVKSLDGTRTLVQQAGFTVIEGEGRFVIPAEEALGVVHYFYED